MSNYLFNDEKLFVNIIINITSQNNQTLKRLPLIGNKKQKKH